MRLLLASSALFAFSALLVTSPAAADVTVADLRCEYRVDPLGIDSPAPRLSWGLKSPKRGQRQTAYQILVASDPSKLTEGQADLWDTGKVTSSETNQIAYVGKPIVSEMRCHWKVRVWDRDGKPSDWSSPAMWSMGLLAKSDWAARWIGFDGSTGGTSVSLAGCKWTWYPVGNPAGPTPTGSVYFRKRLSLPTDRTIRSAAMLLTVDDEFILRVNGTEVARKQGVQDGWRTPEKVDLKSALRAGENLIALEAINLIGPSGETTPAGAIGRLRIEFTSGEPLVVALDSTWKVSRQKAEGWDRPELNDSTWAAAKEVVNFGAAPWGNLGGSQSQMLPAPHFRKTFTMGKDVKRATLYATALGIYEVSINGQRVGQDVLVPGWSDYPKRVYYFTYDVTKQVQKGENAIGAILGDGWYGSYLAFTGKRRFYGGAPRLMLQLCIEAADGTKTIVGTDDSWKASYGPIQQADLLMGERYDARKEMAGWATAGFDASAWQPVSIADNLKMAVQSHPGRPIRRHEELPAQKMTEPKPGVYVYDLGQNMVGWVRLSINGKAGQTVTLRHAEMLDKNGNMYTQNLRAAKAIDTFTLKDGPQVCEPTLTFHGFRYVEITGLDKPLEPANVVGVVVYSDIPRTCRFTCSNPLVNKLVENIHWGQMGNYLDLPTDCPQRDERAGWTGDAQVFMKTAAFNRDISAFTTKWLVDLCQDGQRADGAYPDVAPSILGHGNAAWEDAAVICTWHQYEMYGDTGAIEQHYPKLCRYMDHLAAVSKGHIRPAGAYGDWLLLAGPQHSMVHGTAYYYYCATLMADMAQATGKADDARRWQELAAKIREVFIREFVHEDGTVCDKSKRTGQTLYALALAMDLVPEQLRAKVGQRLVDEIKARDWHLATGFIGTPVLLKALEKINRSDVAYRVVLSETYPSWLLQVKLGSTTMWERWDGWLPNKGFQDAGMNSFNHYWLGCVGKWLYARCAGLDTEGPGFRRVVIRPRVSAGDPGLTSASVAYDSIRGHIESGWKRQDGKLMLNVVIPVNVTATVYVPAADPAKVTEDGRPAAQAPGVKFLRAEAGTAVYEIGSGSYSFVAE